MQNVINNLKLSYDNLKLEQKKLTEEKKEIIAKIDLLTDTLNHPACFDESDIEELVSMLENKDKSKLESIKVYLKVFDKFPNQPQIVNAKKIYEEIKKKIIHSIKEYNKYFFDLVNECEDKIRFLETMIKLLETYSGYEYIDASNLYKLLDILSSSVITDELVKFFELVLQNNNTITSDVNSDEDSAYIKKDLTRFINRLNKINKSLKNDSFENDTLIYNLLCDMLEFNNTTTYTPDKYELIINILTDEIADTKVLKRFNFLIHLFRVEITFDHEQIEFLTQLKELYFNKVSENIASQNIIIKNECFINGLNSDEPFDNIDLLNEVFELNNILVLDMLKVICSIIYQNNKKVSKGKLKLKDN